MGFSSIPSLIGTLEPLGFSLIPPKALVSSWPDFARRATFLAALTSFVYSFIGSISFTFTSVYSFLSSITSSVFSILSLISGFT